ncbi:hypothetical protein [Bradyrhizobium sp. 1(2017)]|uniref:hypothetical protein n=1 Tax=Bradyrhizobium sp. 1(2017) TaxID=1404888 RepID=UPI001AA058B5|nr:hypothetical protein [Bradyrhizobium sp. 1(2017)]
MKRFAGARRRFPPKPGNENQRSCCGAPPRNNTITLPLHAKVANLPDTRCKEGNIGRREDMLALVGHATPTQRGDVDGLVTAFILMAHSP